MRALVVGMGKSGRGAACFLLKLGYEVVGYDDRSFEVLGVQKFQKNEAFDLVILSPGVPPTHPMAEHPCEVIGEAELAFRYMKNRCIGITGTNGKTTLTLLITHVLNQSGIQARALGNVGESLCEYLVNPQENEIIIAELSSFQLETLKTPILDHGVILNITPDHLDRYPSFEVYAQTKCRLKDLVKGDLVVTKDAAKFLSGKKLEVISSDSYLHLTKKERYWRILGYDMAMFAYAICNKYGVTFEQFEESVKSFQKPEHRLEYVGEVKNIHFFNDSKGTNVEASLYAVSQVEGPIHLIAGGMSKKGSFDKWKTIFPGKVRKIFAIGETADQIAQELSETIPVKQFSSLEEAVREAFNEAQTGETVLLSPGCASWDQFSSYEERGKKFKQYVLELNG